MILALEYEHLKNEAMASLAALYNAQLKRVDFNAEKSNEPWAEKWKEYREGGEIKLQEIIGDMPNWMQNIFSDFKNLQEFISNIERAFLAHDEELKQAYQMGKADAKKKPYTDILHEYRMPMKHYKEQLETQRYRHISDIIPEILNQLEPNQI